MEPSREQLLLILSIAREHSCTRGGRGLSLRQLIKESDYRALQNHVGAPELVAVIATAPEIIDDWLAYSEDKRTSFGWGFAPTGNGDWTVFDLDGLREHHTSREAACADFVLRELDFWTAMADVS